MSQASTPISRREWLRRTSALGLSGPGAAFGLNLAALGQASAATAEDYKALVCVFMMGGNDAINTVMNTDASSWATYVATRGTPSTGIGLAAPGTQGIANGANTHLQLGGVLPIAPASTGDGRELALHPGLRAVRDLFAARRLSILANVGPLIGPVTKAAYEARSAALPAKLFSHNDQQATWQSFAPEGSTSGWGGRLMDQLMSGNQRAMFSTVSLSGNAVWLSGQQAHPYQLVPAGAVRVGGSTGAVYGSTAVQQKMQSLMRNVRTNSVLAREHAAVAARSMDAEGLLTGAMPPVGSGPWASSATSATDPLLQYLDPVTQVQKLNPLAYQLQGVARMIAARGTLGMRRQVFFVSMGGFDTHDAQVTSQASLLARLNHALQYFDRTLQQMGVDDNVTTFTASDFGRTFASNGDGTDHGWGGHHFIMGGAVRGGELFGRMPVLGTRLDGTRFNSNDLLASGTLLPSTSVDQYAATLGRWMGVSDSALLDIMPGLRNWNASQRNLGMFA